jgi:large subunit ribosomal protein L13
MSAAMKTYTGSTEEFAAGRKWHVVDAGGRPLGRVASEVAKLLRGKHKPTFTPHLDCGDFVIVINAGQVALTGRKAEQKMYHRHSGYPGGLRSTSYGDLLQRKPEFVLRRTITGMLPRTTPGRAAARRLKVFAGPSHTHQAQQPRRHEF